MDKMMKKVAKAEVKAHEKRMHGKGYRAGGKTNLEMKSWGVAWPRWPISFLPFAKYLSRGSNMDTDKFNYFPAETKDPIGKYTQPKDYVGPESQNGYPNDMPSTQTQKTRGTGAATKSLKHTTKMG